MTDILTPDLCVIGAGSGGLSVAAVAAQLGLEVVLIEKDRMGGDCLNYGCVPSKSLIAAAKAAHAPETSGVFGVDLGQATIDFTAVQAHVQDVIAGIAPHDSVERFEGLGATVIQGTARFTSPREVTVNDVQGNVRVRARRFVIATGSSPAAPPIPGLDTVKYLTNETLFDLDSQPDHLVVLGGGPIGLEMAQAFRRLGSAVTVTSLAFMEKDDPELSQVVLESLKADGVRLLPGASATLIAEAREGVRVTIKSENGTEDITGSHLLVATGRKPNIDGLDLDTANVTFDKTGIKVDRRLRTSNRRIFAIGDVTGRFQFTHTAAYDAGIVIRNAIFRLPAKAQDTAVPWVTFTDPELAHVGLTEATARDAGHRDLRILRWPFAENDRARAERDTRGMIKVVATKSGKVLGASIVGAQAGDLIQPWSLAIERGLKLSAFASYIAPYPTRGEINKRVAGEFFTPTLFGARTRWLVRMLAKLG